MSTNSGTLESDDAFQDYCSVGYNAEKSVSITRKTLDSTEYCSSEQSDPKDDVFPSDQRDTILHDLRTFVRKDGLKITNCIFRSDQVEICYIIQSSSAHNKDDLRQELSDHLKINSKLIKMTKLRAKPTYKDTSIGPGETATNETTNSSCKIGAFVEVEGKAKHALTSGHGKSEGDVLLYQNGKQLGIVNVSLCQPLQPTEGDDGWCCFYRDVALARLEDQDGFIAQVLDAIRSPLCLAAQPIQAANNMIVRRFTSDGRRGRVDSDSYYIWDYDFNIQFRLMSVVSDDGGPIHAEGESGILVATDAAVDGRVNAVGILVMLETMREDDAERTVRITSLAVPLQAAFDALRNDSYCNGATIRLL